MKRRKTRKFVLLTRHAGISFTLLDAPYLRRCDVEVLMAHLERLLELWPEEPKETP